MVLFIKKLYLLHPYLFVESFLLLIRRYHQLFPLEETTLTESDISFKYSVGPRILQKKSISFSVPRVPPLTKSTGPYTAIA